MRVSASVASPLVIKPLPSLEATSNFVSGRTTISCDDVDLGIEIDRAAAPAHRSRAPPGSLSPRQRVDAAVGSEEREPVRRLGVEDG